MISLAEVIAYIADLNRTDAFYELDDKYFFHSYDLINCSFGATSEFYFVAAGRQQLKDTAVDLAERYYNISNPSETYIASDTSNKKLISSKDISSFIRHGRLRWRFEQPDEPMSFYVRGVEPGLKRFEPSHIDFSCLIDAANFALGGSLYYNFYLNRLNENIDDYIKLFKDTCEKLRSSYAVSGISLLYGTYSSIQPELCYPIYKRFPGLVYADVNGFRLETQKREDVIRDVNWLTAVGSIILEKHPSIVKAAEHPPAGVIVHRYDTGVIFQAGARPMIGDANYDDVPPAYKAVNRILRPARFEEYSGPYLRVPDIVDGNAATREWITRFD